MSIKQVIKGWAEIPAKLQYEKKRDDKRGNYMEWLRIQKKDREEIPDPFRVAETDYLARVIAAYFEQYPETLILYGDEDEMTSKGEFQNPWFKPDWSPELMESLFYLGSVIAVRSAFLEKMAPDWKEKLGKHLLIEKGSILIFCCEDPNQEEQDYVTSLCKKAGGWEKGCKSVKHMQGILHHCKLQGGLSEIVNKNLQNGALKSDERIYGNLISAKKASQTGSMTIPCLERLEKVSVIIPTKDHPELLEKCLSSLQQAFLINHGITCQYENGNLCIQKEDIDDGKIPYEVIVVDNGSSEENRQKIQSIRGIQYLYEPMEFDFAKMCNLGAKAAKGDFLLFLNDDVELLPQSNLEKMMVLADRDGVGSVGLKLLYPDSRKIQHAGITNLPMGPVHKMQFLDDQTIHYFGLNRGLHNVLAVTAACVMLRADRFWKAGGFDESLKVAFNDVALGFRLYELGYRNVCMCDSYAYHHESLTRGNDEGQEKLARLLRERDRLFGLFPGLAGKDPYYSPFLNRQGLDVKVRPAFETMNNRVQQVRVGDVEKLDGLSGYREDACLYVRVEDERAGEITGYALILLDDNACYDRRLLLQGEGGVIYAIRLEEQYRPDLKENLKDQRHVALSGFWMQLEPGVLPDGRYRIGAVASRKVGNLRLLNWTNRWMEVNGNGR